MIAGKLSSYIDSLAASVVAEPSLLQRQFSGVSIDSRTIRKGNLFFCVVGEHHDGHDFIAEAQAKGAAAIVVEKAHEFDADKVAITDLIRVPDTLTALGNLAQEYLKQINPRKVAVTGTNGKTTCKNMITAILRPRYRTCTTCGNFNNLYGVPLSIFQFDHDCEVAVLEFGMSTAGEISRLVEIVDPDIRVILNVGPAHLETMKTVDAIAEAKFEILQHARESDWAVLNDDDPHIRSRRHRYKMNQSTFGSSSECRIRPQEVFTNGSGRTHLVYRQQDIRLPIIGRHHLPNCLAAIAVAEIVGIEPSLIKAGLENYQPEEYRMATFLVGDVTIVNDAYNANPVSMAAAFEAVAAMPVEGKRVVLLGDMLELGDAAADYHAQVGRQLVAAGFTQALLVGEFAQVVRDAAIEAGFSANGIEVFTEVSETVERLHTLLQSGDLLLLKASRALQLEKVEIALRATLGRRS